MRNPEISSHSRWSLLPPFSPKKENMLLLLIHPSGPAAPTTTSGPAVTSSEPSKTSAGVSFSKAGAAVMVGFALFTVLLQAIV